MRLLRNGKIESDSWSSLSDDEVISVPGPFIVSLERWRRERTSLLNYGEKLGLRLSATDDIESVADDVRHFLLFALNFENVVSGQHYSNAWLLRSRYGFDGEVRATGAVNPDQIFYLVRCGFNAFSIDDTTNLDDYQRRMEDYSYSYQSAADSRVPVYRRRLGDFPVSTVAVDRG